MFYLTLLFWLCHIGAAFCSLSTSWSSPACISQIQVVPSSNEDSVFRTQRSPDYSQQVGNASLKGRTLPGCHSSSNSSKNGEYFSVLPLEMQMRKPQRKKSHTLSDMRSTLVNRRSAFKSTETEVPTAQFPEMVAPLRDSSSRTSMGPRSTIRGRQSVDQIAPSAISAAQIQLKSSQRRKEQGKRKTQGRSTSCPSTYGSGCCRAHRSTGSHAYLPRGPLADGSPTSYSSEQCTAGPHSCCSKCSRLSCGGQVEDHVCPLGEAPGRPTPGHPKGNEGCQAQGGRGGYKVTSQAGFGVGESTCRATERKCSSTQPAFVLEGLFGRTSCKVASLLATVPTARSLISGKGSDSTRRPGHSALQPCSVKVIAANERTDRSARHCHCERRRRGVQGVKGGCQQQCSEDYGQPPTSRRESQDSERERRRDDVSRAAGSQTPAHRTPSVKLWGSSFRRWGLIFSLGRICMTAVYPIQWPNCPGILPVSTNVFPKWTHSILQEADFCSEWEAAHRATELALQFGGPTFHRPSSRHNHRRKIVGSSSVRFSSHVDVLIGDDEEFLMYQISVPADALFAGNKPWSGCYHSSGVQHSAPNFDFLRDLSCSVEQMFDSFLHKSLPHDNSKECPALSSDPLSFCKAVLIPDGWCPPDAILDDFSRGFYIQSSR